MTDDPRHQLEFRIFIDGELTIAMWIPEHEPEEIAAAQADVVQAALRDGKPVRLEVFDPSLPPTFDTIRIGNEPDGMVNPVLVPLEEIGAMAAADFQGRHDAADYFERTRKAKDDA